MDTNSSPHRETWIDGLKGVTILAVILGHVLSGYLDAGTFPAAQGSITAVRQWIYSYHMPLFFLLSGYTYTLAYWRNQKPNYSKLLRQLLNLVWVYVLFSVLQWVVKALFPGAVNEPFTVQDLLLLFVTPMGNYWYLYVLFFLYVIFTLVRLPRLHPAVLLGLAALSVTVSAVDLGGRFLTLYRILYHGFFFAAGCFLCRYAGALRRRWPLMAAAAVLAALILLDCLSLPIFADGFPHFLLGCTLCTLFVWGFFHCRPAAEARLFQIFGKYCLELYLIHTFLTAGNRAVLPRLGIMGPWSSICVNFLLSAAVSLGVSWACDRLHLIGWIFRPASRLAKKREQSGR